MTTKASPPILKIKKELPNDEIKDYAETAMNELLGLYGFDNVDTRVEISKHNRIMLSRNRQHTANGLRRKSMSPEKTSSRESSKSPVPMHLKIAENLEPDCAWCRRTISSKSSEIFGSQDGPRYCSESCFSQSRRASFKRAKTCDWCRHVRHAVSYVDFQDGASQLQFCSDKCLNQYKMQIFCKETQAHLDMNPHLKERGKESINNLITPDLWLRNCRSRSASPKSDRSQSSSPHIPSAIITSPPSPVLIQKPLISVTEPSKLMSRPNINISRNTTKFTRRRRLGRTMTSNNNNNSININGGIVNPPSNNSNQKPCTVTSSADIRLNNNSPHRQEFCHPFIPPPQHPANVFQIRPPLIPLSPRFMTPGSQMPGGGTYPTEPIRMSPFGPTPPPVTVLVPYPIVIPLPIPIPIPLPFSEFLFAHAAQKQKSSYPENNNTNNKNFNSTNNPASTCASKQTEGEAPLEEPLDFTKNNINSSQNCGTAPTISLPSQQQQHQISPSPPASTIQINAQPKMDEPESPAIELEQKLPKFKITRLNSKRIITSAMPQSEETEVIPTTSTRSLTPHQVPSKESERSRPLRKRKRVLDGEIHK